MLKRMMHDIKNRADIVLLVDEFYKKALVDPSIGPVFHAGIDMTHWEEHRDRIVDFWETVLLGATSYRGNPFSKHMHLPLEARHFDAWFKYFKETVGELFKGEKANEIIDRADKMSVMFSSKLKHIRENKSWKPIL
jgi:hemoglobin